MKIDFEKIGIIASYFAENTNNLYVTKLLKLFYYLDFISFKERGATVTNDIYYKLPYGPVPTALKNEIDILAGNVIGIEYKSQLRKYIGIKADTDNFGRQVVSMEKNNNIEKKLSEYEFDLVKKLSTVFKNTKAKDISNQTHKEKPWLLSSENSIINYELANELDIKKIFSALN